MGAAGGQAARRSGLASMGSEGPRARAAEHRGGRQSREVGFDCGAAGRGSALAQLAPYEVVIRFMVAAGATVVMFQAFRARHYAVAAVFGTLALLYNPVVPVFSFSGDWQRAMVIASSVPFVASLTARKNKERRSART
jgi:hypothetical protein